MVKLGIFYTKNKLKKSKEEFSFSSLKILTYFVFILSVNYFLEIKFINTDI